MHKFYSEKHKFVCNNNEKGKKKNWNWHSCAQPANECNVQCLYMNRAHTTARCDSDFAVRAGITSLPTKSV